MGTPKNHLHKGGSRNSEGGVLYVKVGGGGVRFADFISFYLNTETKLFHFHRIFKNRG